MVLKIGGLSKQLRCTPINLYRTESLGKVWCTHTICYILIQLSKLMALFLLPPLQWVSPTSFLHTWTNAFSLHRISRTLQANTKTPTGFFIIFHSSRKRKLFSKIHFAVLVGKWPSLTTTLFYGNKSFTFPSFTLESSSVGPTPVANPWRETCKPACSSTSTHGISEVCTRLIAGWVSNLNTKGSVSITDFPSCSRQKTKLAFNLSKEVRREIKEQ